MGTLVTSAPDSFRLAQINIAKFRRPMADPINRDFVAALDRVNAEAEGQPGFVWRLTGEGNDATDLHAYDDPDVIVNMSVWIDLNALNTFVYQTATHRDIMRRRKEWFARLDVYQALWWISAGHRPTVAEGQQRLAWIAAFGPTERAFTFTQPFGAPGHMAPEALLDRCA